MVRRILAAMLILSAPAYAGPKPPDVDDYVAVVPQYEAGTTENLPLDAEADTPWRGLTGIETSDESSWKSVTASVGDDTYPSIDYILTDTEIGGHAGREEKMRTTCTTTMIARDDPIRNYGQPGASHLHQFYGAEEVNAWSTYASLRNSRRSKCAGGSLNNTAYWYPAFEKDMGGGVYWAVRAQLQTVYYTNGAGHRGAKIPNGLRFVSVADMDDNYEWMDAIIATANAQPGTSGRYTWGPAGSNAKPWANYICVGTTTSPGSPTGTNSFPYLKKPDGTDPWGGQCTAGKAINIQMGFSACWDGVNLWSTNGYKNVIPRIYDTRYAEWVCPKNYYQIPTVELHLVYIHGGWSDYQTWRLSSDASFQTMINAGPEPRTIGVGESMHADWLDGWDPSIRNSWQTNCNGAEGGRAHECGDSRISDTEKLSIGSAPPDGRRLQIVPIPNEADVIPTSTGNMWKSPTTTGGSHNHDIHG